MSQFPHDRVAMSVIRFLGWSAVIALCGVIYLVHQSVASANEIDPSTVALVSGVSTLAGTAIGVLGAILSVGGRQNVTVDNPPTDPVPVAPAEAEEGE